MKAYILSMEHGVVQIGRTVYHLPVGHSFTADRRGLSNCFKVDVKDNSWKSAWRAYRQAGKEGLR